MAWHSVGETPPLLRAVLLGPRLSRHSRTCGCASLRGACREKSGDEAGAAAEDSDGDGEAEGDLLEAEDLDRDIETLEVRLSLAENGIEEAMAVLGLKSANNPSSSGAGDADASKPVKRAFRLGPAPCRFWHCTNMHAPSLPPTLMRLAHFCIVQVCLCACGVPLGSPVCGVFGRPLCEGV